MADSQPIPRGWFSYVKVAKEYLGVSPDILLRAIKRGELKAYVKPLTRGRKEGATHERNVVMVCLADVDEWIRTFWQPYPTI